MELGTMSATLTRTAIEALVAKARANGKGANASAANGQLELLDEREPGLRFRVGERSAGWSLLVRLKNGQRSRIKLGAWPGMGISEARVAARDVRSKIEQGMDPNEEKRIATRNAALEARNRTTLKDLLDLYETSVLSGQRQGADTRRALDGKKGLLRSLSSRAPASISREEIIDLARKQARTAPISANRKLAYAHAFFNWAVDEGVVPANPADKIRKPGKERQRDRYHTLAELMEIWAAAGELGYPFQQLFRLLIVLPMRRQEIAGMPVADLDLGSDDAPGQGVWTLPAARTKRANALRVPIPALAREILLEAINHEDRPGDSKLVFTTTGDTPISGFTKGRRRLDVAIAAARSEGAGEDPVDEMPHWVVHDFRTTFNTHGCEILGIPPHVADRVLNHVATATRSKIMRVYNKSELFEPRREALAAWAVLLKQRVITPSIASKVNVKGN
jgi:integrase